MKLTKIITKTIVERENFDCEIKEATLLSIEEYKKYESIIPLLKKWWWLRSPGYYQSYAAGVSDDGGVYERGINVAFDFYAVRPALKIQISNSESFKSGDKLDLLDKKWTVLDVLKKEIYILCNESIGNHKFDSKSNIWETSELKTWLESQL